MIAKAVERITGGFPTLDDLADLPCIMNALDEMQEQMDNGDPSMSELENIAQDAAFELLEEEGFPT